MSANPTILFLCTGNSCRSQMAEGFARAAGLNAHSAGTHPKPLDQRAVRVMQEVGIDISRHTPKTPADLAHTTFDLVITVCDAAHEACPVFPGATRTLHQPFDDPPRLAHNLPDEQALPHYRRVRDEIRAYIQTLPESLQQEARA